MVVSPVPKLVRRTTDVVLEGYPSSANSYSQALLRFAFDGVSLSSHTHCVANLKLAMIYKVPVVFVIRRPEDAIASLAVRFELSNYSDLLTDYLELIGFLNANLPDSMVFLFEDVTEQPEWFINSVADGLNVNVRGGDAAGAASRAGAYVSDWIMLNGTDFRGGLPNSERKIAAARAKKAIMSHAQFGEAREVYESVKMRAVHFR